MMCVLLTLTCAGFVTEHVRITQFLSKAYRCLCVFEASHKRRQVTAVILINLFPRLSAVASDVMVASVLARNCANAVDH
jgi:hypothetical protein